MEGLVRDSSAVIEDLSITGATSFGAITASGLENVMKVFGVMKFGRLLEMRVGRQCFIESLTFRSFFKFKKWE